MISAVSSVITVYKPKQRLDQPAVTTLIAVDAAASAEQARKDNRAKVATDERQMFLQTQYVGPARDAARLAALSGARPQALQIPYVGPARAAARTTARLAALDATPNGGMDMQSNYQDLHSGCYAGPKPASFLTAQAGYMETRNAAGGSLISDLKRQLDRC